MRQACFGIFDVDSLLTSLCRRKPQPSKRSGSHLPMMALVESVSRFLNLSFLRRVHHCLIWRVGRWRCVGQYPYLFLHIHWAIFSTGGHGHPWITRFPLSRIDIRSTFCRWPISLWYTWKLNATTLSAKRSNWRQFYISYQQSRDRLLYT